jgi:hypothetical protein
MRYAPPVSTQPNLLTYPSIKRKADEIEDISDHNKRLEHTINNYDQLRRRSRAVYLPNAVAKPYPGQNDPIESQQLHGKAGCVCREYKVGVLFIRFIHRKPNIKDANKKTKAYARSREVVFRQRVQYFENQLLFLLMPKLELLKRQRTPQERTARPSFLYQFAS